MANDQPGTDREILVEMASANMLTETRHFAFLGFASWAWILLLTSMERAVTDFSVAVDDSSNSWNGIAVSAADVKSINMKQLMAAARAPRKKDGSLPEIGLHLNPRSRLIDAGTDVGQPFRGKAPDLGAFESAR